MQVSLEALKRVNDVLDTVFLLALSARPKLVPEFRKSANAAVFVFLLLAALVVLPELVDMDERELCLLFLASPF